MKHPSPPSTIADDDRTTTAAEVMPTTIPEVDSHGFYQSIVLTLPPLGAIYLAPADGDRPGSA